MTSAVSCHLHVAQLIAAEPGSARWREMRAEALVDGKNFPAAVIDFDAALGLISGAQRA
jgi:hypothetical protein